METTMGERMRKLAAVFGATALLSLGGPSGASEVPLEAPPSQIVNGVPTSGYPTTGALLRE